MRNTISQQDLHDLMDELGIDTEADHEYSENYLTTDYSGRGMYGDRCIGIVTTDPAGIMFELGMAVGERASNETGTTWWDLAESFKRTAEDSMGRSSIVYFPSLTLDTDPVAVTR